MFAYKVMIYLGLILGIIFLFISIYIFIKFKIFKLILDILGISEKKEIDKYNASNMNNNRNLFFDNFKEKKEKDYRNEIDSLSNSNNDYSYMQERDVLTDNAIDILDNEATDILDNEATDILDVETTVLKDDLLHNINEKIDFNIIKNVIYINTDEVIS